jgi:hypothetical protein
LPFFYHLFDFDHLCFFLFWSYVFFLFWSYVLEKNTDDQSQRDDKKKANPIQKQQQLL